MPYKIVMNKIYSKATGKWVVKQTCTSAINAKKALKLLEGVEQKTLKKSEIIKKPVKQIVKQIVKKK